MALSDFKAIYDKYVQEAAHNRLLDAAEAKAVTLFTHFMREAFGIETRDFIQEQTIRMAQIDATGRIDLLFGGLVLEFKRKLTRNTDPRQLENYLRALAGEDKEYTGIFTDGVQFQVYALIDDRFTMVDDFTLGEINAETARLRLDAYLFSQHSQPPTAEDIVLRYGITSPTFRKAAQELRRLLARVDKTPMLATWRAQWQRLLSRVYGSDVGNDELFVRHTYLSQFARLLAYATLHGLPENDQTILEIIRGDAFQKSGVSNIGEADFFSWILMDEIRGPALRLFDRLAQTFVVYNLRQINQDLLKQLYQSLVDVSDRHDLGEYYTPDWLAELVLRDINYRPGQSLYDPTCGSGTFLFSAIKHLQRQGMRGQELVEFAAANIVGTDVHPLAVTIARLNYLLALSEDLRTASGGRPTRLITIPIYMADAMPRTLEDESAGLRVPVSDETGSESFIIPMESAREHSLMTSLIELIEGIARHDSIDVARFQNEVRSRHEQHGVHLPDESISLVHWLNNVHLLKRLIDNDRNSIWKFILNNIARPLAFTRHGFDLVVGNPPWLSYRFIKNRDYQADVKALYSQYELIEPGQSKLVTQMDLSSLFYEVARNRYLKPGGTLAFVMPRSVITGAKQHRAFQRKGITRALDMKDVEPLFNVPTCVLIYAGEAARDPLPLTAYSGKLPAHEMDWQAAEPHLRHSPASLSFVEDAVRSPHYYDKFFQGATLVPRNFCFVRPQGSPGSPAVMTDPEVDREAKPPYKGLSLRGVVHDPYLYATLLSKHLVPFGYERLHVVALPFIMGADGRLRAITDPADYVYAGHGASGEWFAVAAAKREELKKAGDLSLVERLNYQNTLVNQLPTHPYKVIQNASGSNITACVLDISSIDLVVYGRQTQAFVAETGTYSYDAESADEAYYLCAALNADSVNQAIKVYQAYGLMGARHIHRTPLEACGIPPFDAGNAEHLKLAALSREAHAAVELLKTGGGLSGGVSSIRKRAREAVQKQLTAIDEIVQRIVEF